MDSFGTDPFSSRSCGSIWGTEVHIYVNKIARNGHNEHGGRRRKAWHPKPGSDPKPGLVCVGGLVRNKDRPVAQEYCSSRSRCPAVWGLRNKRTVRAIHFGRCFLDLTAQNWTWGWKSRSLQATYDAQRKGASADLAEFRVCIEGWFCPDVSGPSFSRFTGIEQFLFWRALKT